jgi:hypothetical protein
MSVQDMLMPPGWDDDPNWDSDTSIWAMLKGPEDAEATDQPKTSSKKHKKRAHNSELKSCSLMAIYEEVTRLYLTRSSMNTVDDEVLAVERRSACHTYTLPNTEQAKNMLVPTPQYVE